MKRPLLWGLGFLTAGIITGRYVNGSLLIVLFFTCAFLATMLLYERFKWRGLLVFLLFFAVGFFNIKKATAENSEFKQFTQHQLSTELSGIVEDIGKTGSGNEKLTVKLNKNTKIQVITEASGVSIGQEISMRGVLQELSPKRNPAGYDEALYLKSRGIDYKMIFPDKITGYEIKPSIWLYMMDIKSKLSEVYDKVLPEREAAIAKSVVIGDKSGLDDYISELYRLAGVYHILAISGLHISMIAMFFEYILGNILSKKLSSVVTILGLIIYCIFTGAAVSSIRAVVMCSVLLIGNSFPELDKDSITATTFAAVLLLIYQPLYLWDIGFQYSFSAVYGLIILTPVLKEYLLGNKRTKLPSISDGLLSAISATIATFPVMAYHFYYFTTYSIIANILIIPTVGITMLLAFTTGVLGLISINASIFLAGTLFSLLKTYEACCAFFVSLPFSRILIGKPPLAFVLGFAVLVIIFAYYKKVLFPATIAYILLISVLILMPEPEQVVMLDVGQGDSFVIHSKGKTFVIDGGGNRSSGIGENTGVNVLIPYLDYKGISKVDGVFLSHSDADHSIGIIELCAKKRIGALYVSHEIEQESELGEILISEAKRNKIPVEYLGKGDRLEFEGCTFTCIWPDSGNSDKNSQSQANKADILDPNTNSLVIKFVCENISFLFTGDIDSAVEKDILDLDIKADVLKLAHHGSKNSSDDEFLNKVAPAVAIVSAGVNNSYGHPSAEVLDKLEKRRIPIYNTAESGAVIIELDKSGIRFKRMIYE